MEGIKVDDDVDFSLNNNNGDLKLNQNLEILQDQINYLSDRIRNGKIKNVQNEEIKIKWIKALAYICKIHASIRKDEEVQEIREEIKNLKKVLQID